MAKSRDINAILFNIEDGYNVSFEGGSLSRTTFKSLFFNIKALYVTEQEDKKFAMRKTLRRISQLVGKHLDTDLFYDKHIMVQNVSDSFIKTGKTFVIIEYTFFPKVQIDRVIARNQLNKLADVLSREVFLGSDDMKFYKTNKIE